MQPFCDEYKELLWSRGQKSSGIVKKLKALKLTMPPSRI
jgi:hypothetical protein